MAKPHVNRTIAITGATGFIGRHLVADLASAGFDPVAIVRPDSLNRPPEQARVVRVPLDVDALADACAGARSVVHLAGIVQAGRETTYTQVNVAGTAAIAAAAARAGARLVHVSSLSAAGPAAASAPHREDDPPKPITAYGRSKLHSEAIVRQTPGLEWSILRPGAVYGPGDRAVLPLFKLVKRGWLPLAGNTQAAFTFVHVSDVVRTIRAAIEQDAAVGEIFFVGHRDAVTSAGLIDTLEEVLGRRAHRVAVPAPLMWVAAEVGEAIGRATGRATTLNRSRYAEIGAEGFVCAVDRLRDRLGVEALVNLREGLGQTAQWYEDHGWL